MHDARPDAPGIAAPLARGGVDQDHTTRDDPDRIRLLLGDPTTRVVVVHRDRGLMTQAQDAAATPDSSAAPALALLVPADVGDSVALVYLGRAVDDTPTAARGTAFFAAVLDADQADQFSDARWVSLRDVGARLTAVESTLLTQAVAIGQWHLDHRYSPLSGRPLSAEKAGWVLRAGRDEPEQFPRTDPVVIVAVTDSDDRLLLGSNALWQSNRFSVLAGFVEPGESLEAAVEREVFEESGLRVIEPRYQGSQSWPFPRSLMLGFSALADPSLDQQLVPDGEEIVELRWFTRDDIRGATGIVLPGRTSIARRLIEQWLGQPLEDDRW